MTDIVERLRNHRIMVNLGHGNVDDVPDDDCEEAADVIEQYRIKISRLRDVLTWSEQNCAGKCAGQIRDALNETA